MGASQPQPGRLMAALVLDTGALIALDRGNRTPANVVEV